MKLRGWHLAAVWAVILTVDLLLFSFAVDILMASVREIAHLVPQH